MKTLHRELGRFFFETIQALSEQNYILEQDIRAQFAARLLKDGFILRVVSLFYSPRIII